MQGLKYGKGVVRCGFCNGIGHNITTCKDVEAYYEDYLTRTEQGQSVNRIHHRALKEMIHRKARKNKTPKPKAKPRCSFCRLSGHRRPKCDRLKNLRQQLYHANEDWRRSFVNLVNTVGLGIGAYVKVPLHAFTWPTDRVDWTSCLVVGYDLESLNIFNLYKGRDNYTTKAKMKLSSVAAAESFYWPFNRHQPFVESGLIRRGWLQGNQTAVISGATWKPPESWYREECEEIEYVIETVSTDSPAYNKISDLLTEWIEL